MEGEYAKFYGQKVGIITVGRAREETGNDFNVSLCLEGVLDKDTQNQIFLKDMIVRNMDYDADADEISNIESIYGSVLKDKIISLYLIGNFKVKKVPKTEKANAPELITEEPKSA